MSDAPTPYPPGISPGPQDPILPEPPADDGDDEDTARARHLLFATRHTAKDIPALLRRARLLRLSGQGELALQLLEHIELVALEYVLSDRLCMCGGQLDRAGRCWNCIEMAGARASAAQTAAARVPGVPF